MNIKQNISLRPFNSFHIEASCQLFAGVNSQDDLQELIRSGLLNEQPYFILGGGNNVLFTKDFDGLILKMNAHFIEIINSGDEYVLVKAGAGVDWNDFVEFALANNLSGIENLTGIPGTVGASAFQNIGAYGVEAKDCIEEVELTNLRSGDTHLLKNKDCRFGYRNSIFKQRANQEDIITSVTYKLSKVPRINTSYGNIRQELERKGILQPTLHDISHIIKAIRSQKLPDPERIGSGGSFFKNPVISEENFRTLKDRFPEVVAYPHAENEVKVSAGWLIDRCGWKGKSIGQAGVYEKQALVLVNLGNANGKEILHLADAIRYSVKEMFRIELEPEVIIL